MGNIQNMGMSDNGTTFVKQFEGEILYCYDDYDPNYPKLNYNAGYGGTITIGYGHTNSTPPAFGWGDTWTVEQATKVLKDDLTIHMQPLKDTLGNFELNQNQYDALASFAYNLGAYIWFDGGNTLLTNIQSKNWQAVADEMKLFVYSGGTVMDGLVRRRNAEAELLLTPFDGTETNNPGSNNSDQNQTKPGESEQKPNPPAESGQTETKKKITIEGGTFYLRNNELRQLGKLGTVFTRVQDFFYPAMKNAEAGSGDENQNANKPSGDSNIKDGINKLNEFMEIVESVPLRSLVYQSTRPAQNPLSCGWADCSGFVGWCLSTFYPDCWNGGNLNTATIHEYFVSKNLVVGTGQDLVKMKGDLGIRRGDLVNMSDNESFSAGFGSHIGVYVDDDRIVSMDLTPAPNIYTTAETVSYRTPPQFYAIYRPFQNKEEKPGDGGTLTAGQQAVSDWINANTGKWIDVDGAYGAQCMDLAVRYSLDFWNFRLNGNAENLRFQELPAGWQRIQDSPGFVPQLGDIFVWYGQNHPMGHTGIVISGNENNYTCLNQNTAGTNGGAGSEAVVSTYNYSAGPFWGVVRPPIS